MRYAFTDLVFLEVPDEVSLLFFITGCPHHCKACHSAALWTEDKGSTLNPSIFEQHLDRYQGLITCVCFFGGEWWPERLSELLDLAQARGLKTCLYTGLEAVSPALQDRLDFLKTGPWRQELGGLDQLTTNQRMIAVKTGECLNARFQSHKDVVCINY